MAEFRQLRRVHFFAGQLLTAEDLEAEQEYNLDRLRRRNRFLHGWGVVAGLGVSIEAGTTVVVEPGLAIDCAGHELVLEAQQRLPISGVVGRCHVVLRYEEIPLDPRPAAGDATVHSRVQESACVELAGADPSARHGSMGRGTPGCGQAHPLWLAAVDRRGARWRIVRRGRTGPRRRAHRR